MNVALQLNRSNVQIKAITVIEWRQSYFAYFVAVSKDCEKLLDYKIIYWIYWILVVLTEDLVALCQRVARLTLAKPSATSCPTLIKL